MTQRKHYSKINIVDHHITKNLNILIFIVNGSPLKFQVG